MLKIERIEKLIAKIDDDVKNGRVRDIKAINRKRRQLEYELKTIHIKKGK